MVKLMPSLTRWHVRWPLPLNCLPSEDSVVGLDHLRRLHIAGDMSEETELFLSRLRAPDIRFLHVTCDMSAPCNPEALPAIARDINIALQTLTTDAEALRVCLSAAQDSLEEAGYYSLANTLDIGVIPPLLLGWMDEEEVGPGPEVMRAAAQQILQGIAEQTNLPAPPHSGFLMERVVQSALAIPAR